MQNANLRHARTVLPIAEFVVISVALLPWMNATASDGPHDGQTWSWNILGWPLVPGSTGMLIWAVTVLIVCSATWLVLSLRILRETR